MPLLGVMSAFLFAGQMVNFPVAGGTSGHLLGGVLAGVLLGPGAAIMAMTTVLGVQCLFFQDGGLTALGANTLNLALVGAGAGYLAYRGCRLVSPSPRSLVPCAAVAAWVSLVFSAAACALELAFSGTAPLGLVLPGMVAVHAVIGLGEAMITAAVLGFVLRVRPDLVAARNEAAAPLPLKAVLGYGLAVTMGVAVLLAPLASEQPDGLEAMAQRLGFAGRESLISAAPLASYTMPGVKSEWLGTSVAGITGVLLTLCVVGVLWAWRLGRRCRSG
jgi:cobalt/nickel transport system permease protein